MFLTFILWLILIEEERSKGISILANHNDTETSLRPYCLLTPKLCQAELWLVLITECLT